MPGSVSAAGSVAFGRAGVDVVLGWVETHGRRETEALTGGLERLPPRRVEYRGLELAEFDLDAALTRRPALVLLDELAHTNAAGSRHARRWQDVEELLAAGLDVFTTLNVQHVESLNDVVAQVPLKLWLTRLDKLDRAQTQGVVAHEMAHVGNRDTRIFGSGRGSQASVSARSRRTGPVCRSRRPI